MRVSISNLSGSTCSGVHVAGRSEELAELGEQLLLRRARGCRLGQAEIDDAWDGFAVDVRDQDVGGLQIAMDDRLLMRVLHAIAGLHEQRHAFPDLESVFVAEPRDRDAGYVFHDQVRLSRRCRAGLEHLGDRGMIHDRERLTLRPEALHGCLVVHAGLDQFQGDLAPQRLDLLGQPYLSHTALAEFADQQKSVREQLTGRSKRRCVRRIEVECKASGQRRARELGAHASPTDSKDSSSARSDASVAHTLIEDLARDSGSRDAVRTTGD